MDRRLLVLERLTRGGATWTRPASGPAKRGRVLWMAALFAAIAPVTRAGSVVYTNDFENAAGKEWSDEKVDATPRDNRKFLGPHTTDVLSLKLDKLPKHTMVRVSFELFVIQTWDGNVEESRSGPGRIGPDVWRMTLAADPAARRPAVPLVDATFSNYEAGLDANWPDGRKQSYPSVLAGESNAAKTGASERNTLGYEMNARNGLARGMDSVYKMSFVIPHDAARLQFDFQGAEGLNPADDECWGLDNVKVEALDDADVPRPDLAEMRRLWEAVGGRDAEAEAQAFWRLVAAGDTAARFLRDKVRPAGVDRAQFAAHLKLMDADAFADRERGTEAIKAMGPGVEPAIREALARGRSDEVKLRLESVLKSMAAAPPADPEERRRTIAMKLLRTIGTPEATKIAGELTGK